MKRICIIAMLCGGGGIASAQVDSILAFYPLHTGDFWQYLVYYENAYCEPWDTSYYSLEVVGDTILSNGFVYKIVDGGIVPSRSYFRLDTVLANVYRFDDFLGDCLTDSLRADVGNLFTSCGGTTTECLSVDTVNILGEITTAKEIYPWVIFGWSYILARGFGRALYADFEEGGVCPPYVIVHDLIYARIEGVEYGTLVDVRENAGLIPTSASLAQSYPNPFNSISNFEFRISQSSDVSLKIFNLLGEVVATLVSGRMDAGTHSVQWDATGQPSGVYFCRLEAGGYVETRNLVLLR